MDILLRNALRRNIRRARAVGDLARADRLQQRLEPVPMAKPAAIKVPAPKRRGRPRKEVTTPVSASVGSVAGYLVTGGAVELPPDAPAETEE
jgi:hypothetical protein